MTTAAILDFQIYEVLLADGIWRAETHYCAKCRQNRCFVEEMLQFFKFSKWPPLTSLIFKIMKFYWLTLQNLHMIDKVFFRI